MSRLTPSDKLSYLSSALSNQNYVLVKNILNQDNIESDIILSAVQSNLDGLDNDMLEIILSSENVKYDRALINDIYQAILDGGYINLFPSFINLIDPRVLIEDAITSPESTATDIVELLRLMGPATYNINEAYQLANIQGRIDVMQAIEHYLQQF